MLNQNSGFRNKMTKCFYNDNGYCRFKEECKKQHSLHICDIKKCDKFCQKRHPIKCKYEGKCKFNAKSICAFSHEVIDENYENIDTVIKPFEDKISILEEVIVNNKTENDDKVNSLLKDIKDMKNQSVENDKVINKLKKENQEIKESLIKNKEESAKISKKLEELENEFGKNVKTEL